MNEAKLSNDELIRRLNELREVIINDKGDAVMRYTFVNADGKSETFDSTVTNQPFVESM